MWSPIRELVGARALLRTLIWRELTVRYKRSALGMVWALAEPAVLVLLYVLVFGHIFGAAARQENYPVFVLLGLMPWIFFASTLEQAAGVLLEHAPLLRKVRFPWETLVFAVAVSRLTTLLVGLALSLAVAPALVPMQSLAWERLAYLPLGLAMLFTLTYGAALVVAALQTILRDVAFLVRFVLRLAFYACPIIYSLEMVPTGLQAAIAANPLAGILWCFQAASSRNLLHASSPALAASLATAAIAGLAGIALFRRLRPLVADLL